MKGNITTLSSNSTATTMVQTFLSISVTEGSSLVVKTEWLWSSSQKHTQNYAMTSKDL